MERNLRLPLLGSQLRRTQKKYPSSSCRHPVKSVGMVEYLLSGDMTGDVDPDIQRTLEPHLGHVLDSPESTIQKQDFYNLVAHVEKRLSTFKQHHQQVGGDPARKLANLGMIAFFVFNIVCLFGDFNYCLEKVYDFDGKIKEKGRVGELLIFIAKQFKKNELLQVEESAIQGVGSVLTSTAMKYNEHCSRNIRGFSTQPEDSEFLKNSKYAFNVLLQTSVSASDFWVNGKDLQDCYIQEYTKDLKKYFHSFESIKWNIGGIMFCLSYFGLTSMNRRSSSKSKSTSSKQSRKSSTIMPSSSTRNTSSLMAPDLSQLNRGRSESKKSPYESLTIQKLKELLKERKLPVSGNKRELVSRLTQISE
jgi:hypothetical protein